jgi:hypothetical protein
VPLPNSRVVHPQFEAHHRPVSANAMPAECTITRPSSPSPAGWNDATGRNVYPAPTTVYPTTGHGVCRVNRGGPGGQGSAAPVTVADRAVTVAQYTVVIPADAAALVQVHDIVTITRCPGDPDLVGRKLWVTDSARGSLTWERVLNCELQPPTTR